MEGGRVQHQAEGLRRRTVVAIAAYLSYLALGQHSTVLPIVQNF